MSDGHRRVRQARLEMWLGFTGFFLFMAVVNLIGVLAMGGSPIVALALPAVLAAVFLTLLARWRRSRREGR